MGRMFMATIDSASATTQRDIVQVVPATEVPIKIHRVVITTDIETDANEAQFELEFVRYTGTFTDGTGGATVTGYALGALGTTEDSAVVEVGNTTQSAVGTGTQEILANIWVNNRVGFEFLPTPEERPVIAGTDAFVVQMTAAFASATAVGGYVVYEELVS